MAFVGLSVPSRVKFGGDRRSVRGLDRVRWTCVAMASVELIKGGGVTTPLGFRAVGMKAGFKESGGMDLAVIVADEVRSFCLFFGSVGDPNVAEETRCLLV